MPDYDWMSVASMQVSEPVGQSSWYRSLLIQTDEAGLVPGSAARAAFRRVSLAGLAPWYSIKPNQG